MGINTLEEKSTDELVVSVVRRLGNPVSTMLLHLPCKVFSIPQVDGMIGYQLVNNCAIVIGDPLCLPQDMAELSQAFHHHCQTNNLSIIYLLVSDSFSRLAMSKGCHVLIQVGEELFVNPTKFQVTQKLRWKINQSLHHGIVIKEYEKFDQSLASQMNQVVKTWLNKKHGPQVHLGNLIFSPNSSNERIFYALQKGEVVGILTLSPIDRFHGWVVTSFLAVPKAYTGTTELLITSVIDILAHENCQYLCLGVIAGSKLGDIEGLSSISKLGVKLVYKLSRAIFRLNAKKIYLDKFHPSSKHAYVLFNGKLGLNELMAIKQILNVKL